MKLNDFQNRENRRLSDLCKDHFSLILQLRSADDFGEADEVRQKIKTLFNKLEKEGKSAGFDPEHIEQVKYALTAFLDETILNSDWPHKAAWNARPLQLEYFGHRVAGEEFFNRLDELRQHPGKNAELIEVFYLCLSLGYRGRLGLSSADSFRRLIYEIAMEFGHTKLKATNDVSPRWKRPDEIIQMFKGPVIPWFIIASTAAVTFLLFLVLSIWIDYSLDSTVEALRNYYR